MPGRWIDAHCHLADTRLAADVDAVLARSRAAGVVAWVQGGVGPDDWQRQRELRARIGADLHLAFGLHPWWVAERSDSDIDRALAELETALAAPDSGAIALGELGLDHLPRWQREPSALPRQMRAFAEQLALAARLELPLVLHVVRAHRDALAVLERHGPLPCGGLVHSFAGSADEARRYLELGLHLSVGGSLVGAREQTRRQLSHLPIDRVVVETDSPDQLPRAWQLPAPARNEPANLLRIAAELAPIWGLSGPDLLDRSRTTLEHLFGIRV